MLRKLLTEFIGTFFLVFVIAVSWDPFAIGIILMVMVYMWGHISGAHYNPAATIGVLVRGKINAKEAIGYIITQLVAAFVAVVVALAVTWTAFVPAPAESADMWQAFAVELIFTFALVSVILQVATNKKTKDNDYYGLAIWFTILAAAIVGGPISGWAFNPAVWLWPWFLDAIRGEGFEYVWLLYLVAPLLWWVLAGLTYKVITKK